MVFYIIFILFMGVFTSPGITQTGPTSYYYLLNISTEDKPHIAYFNDLPYLPIDSHTILIHTIPDTIHRLVSLTGVKTKLVDRSLLSRGTKSPFAAKSIYSLPVVLPSSSNDESFIRTILSSITVSDTTNYIQTLQNFKTRYSFASNHELVRDYLVTELQSFGLTVSTEQFKNNETLNYNIIATQTGQVKPESIIIISAHYDSVSNKPYELAPGADDNATGIAGVLIAAKMLARYKFNFTIRYILFDGEEQGLIGSQTFARNQNNNNVSIVGVINLDMIGYWRTGVKYDFNVTANTHSEWLVNYMIEVSSRYVGMKIEKTVNDAAWWSDHSSFWDYGYPAVMGAEAYDWYAPDFNPYYHTTEETLDKLNPEFIVDNIKVAIGTLIGLADYYNEPFTITILEPDGVNDNIEQGNKYTIYWSTSSNPTELDIYFKRTPSSDRNKIYIGTVNSTNRQYIVDSTFIPAGEYFVLLTDRNTGDEELSSGILKVLPKTGNGIYVYPNPFSPENKHIQLTFVNLPIPSNIQIYTVSGTLIWEKSGTTTLRYSWEGSIIGTNTKIKSGVYLYIVSNSNGQKHIGKFAVIK